MTVTATAKEMVVRSTKDDKADVRTTMITTTLMTTTTNKMTENNDDDDDKMRMTTTTTINLVQYNSDGEGKRNGGAGVMGWPVGQATCMVLA